MFESNAMTCRREALRCVALRCGSAPLQCRGGAALCDISTCISQTAPLAERQIASDNRRRSFWEPPPTTWNARRMGAGSKLAKPGNNQAVNATPSSLARRKTMAADLCVSDRCTCTDGPVGRALAADLSSGLTHPDSDRADLTGSAAVPG